MSWDGFVSWAVDYVESPTSLALFRMSVGLVVLYTLFVMGWSGVIDVVWVGEPWGGIRPLPGSWLVKLLGGPSPTVVWGMVYTAAGAAAALTVGFGGRMTAFVCLQTLMACTDLNGHAGGSYDELLLNALWLLVLAPNSATWSVDCRWRTGHWVDDTPRWAFVRFLAVFQLVLMYATTGWQKLSAYWTPGGDFSALYYILQQPSWQRVDMEWLAPLFPLTQLATVTTWTWEVLSPLWLVAFWYALTPDRGGLMRTWSNKLRVTWVYAGLGIFFHLAVEVMMNIGPFSWASLAFYVCLAHPNTWDAAIAKIRARS